MQPKYGGELQPLRGPMGTFGAGLMEVVNLTVHSRLLHFFLSLSEVSLP